MTALLPVLAVTGLHAEARIAAGPGVTTLSGGGDAARLALMLQESLAGEARAVISFGIAGGLAPGLPPGTVIVASAVDDGEARWTTDLRWASGLRAALPNALPGMLAAVDQAVAGAAGKAALYGRSGAIAVDMESHIAARLAARHGVPFAALRVVADPAKRSLPQAALVGMRPDGSTDVLAVLRTLVAKPGEIPALIHTAFDARTAFAALRRSRRALGPILGFVESRPDAALGDRIPALPSAEEAIEIS